MIRKTALFFLLSLILTVSCKKKSDDCNSCPSGDGIKPPPGLTFVVNGTNGTITADSAWFSPTTRIITAYYQGNSHKLVIKTSAVSVAKYMISAANTVTYSQTLSTYTATSGEVNITGYTGTTLSGDFLTLGNSGGITSVRGSFNELPKR